MFDEIDAGIGGRAAEAVGKKLKALCEDQAGAVHHPLAPDCLICRSPLPDREDEKFPVAPRRRSVPLDREDRTEEIARMLSGAKLTETSLKHAEQMLKANG